WLLRHQAKQVTVAMPDALLAEFAFLPGADEIVGSEAVGSDYDLIVALDMSSADRMAEVFRADAHADIPIAVIDHHITNTRFGAVNWVQAECAATAQMLTYLAMELEVPLRGPLAECLLTGIITDTLCFRTSNTTPAVLEAAMCLQQGGADLAAIVSRTVNRMPFTRLRLWSLTLGSATLQDRVLWVTVRRDQLITAGQNDDDSGLSSILSMVEEADMSAVFTEKIGKNGQATVECSFRAKPGFNVGDLAYSLGGGGHAPASGCTLVGNLEEVVNRVVAALIEERRRQAQNMVSD
ncbi:MAG: hypothetical protein H3C34_27035, partial [Caldilineaceae bacterium]|nr:hypothetical protein [Caldilineaceae bacterium]